jgi:hypothetical protein
MFARFMMTTVIHRVRPLNVCQLPFTSGMPSARVLLNQA